MDDQGPVAIGPAARDLLEALSRSRHPTARATAAVAAVRIKTRKHPMRIPRRRGTHRVLPSTLPVG